MKYIIINYLWIHLIFIYLDLWVYNDLLKCIMSIDITVLELESYKVVHFFTYSLVQKYVLQNIIDTKYVNIILPAFEMQQVWCKSRNLSCSVHDNWILCL